MDAQDQWQCIYTTRQPIEVGWYEADPAICRRLVRDAIAEGSRSVINVGGGASSLVDHLLDLSLDRVAVLDVSEVRLDVAKAHLGARAADVEWIVGDVTELEDVGHFHVWHDRALFHFLLDPAARRRYVALSTRTVEPRGRAVMAAFGPNGPERCSGLEVRRFSADDLDRECGPASRLSHAEGHVHKTPRGAEQSFTYAAFERVELP